MAIIYEWKIKNVETYPSHTDNQDNTESDVIHTIHWILIGTDDVNNVFGQRIGIAHLRLEDLSGFTDFDNVTKAQAVTWVEAWMDRYPDSTVIKTKERLAATIAKQITPTSEMKTLEAE